MLDTIAAISSAIGEGGIGIVRMSGVNAFEIGEKVFNPFKKNKGKFIPICLYSFLLKDSFMLL